MRAIIPAALMSPVVLPTTAWAQGWGPMHDWIGWGSGGMVLGPLLMIAWLAILVAAIVLVVRWLGGSSGLGSPRQTPREILDERFAKGEIDHEEYEKRRKTLGV